MKLSMGIIGLPNVGKSTTFNALTQSEAAMASNYAFCTIDPNKALVNVPDERLDAIAAIVNPDRIMSATVEFVDIAGLVKGASKGEGLGNQFLSNIKETSALLHLVRSFDDDNILHVEGKVNVLRDISIIEEELLLADMQTLENKIAKLERQAKGQNDLKKILKLAQDLLVFLSDGHQVAEFDNKSQEAFLALDKELRFLTNKNMIYVANVNEDGLEYDNEYVKQLKTYAAKKGRAVIKICAKAEEEMLDFSPEEKKEFLESIKADGSGLDQVIKKSFATLGFISYFTAGKKEVRAWTITKGDKAPKAASAIHKDFEKGFIKAEVIAFDDYIKASGASKAKEAGLMRLEGKDYTVQDGDVILFRFNV